MCHDVHGTEFREYFDLKIDLRVLKCPVRYWMHTATSIQHWKTTKLWLLWQNSVHYFVTKWYMVTNGFLCMSLSQHDKAKSGKLSINGNEQSRWKLPNILCTFFLYTEIQWNDISLLVLVVIIFFHISYENVKRQIVDCCDFIVYLNISLKERHKSKHTENGEKWDTEKI